jgi:hypothetical protein
MFRRGPRISLLAAIYIVIGIFVAWDHNYFDNVNTFKEILSAAFAIVLWPLVVIGVNLRIRK